MKAKYIRGQQRQTSLGSGQARGRRMGRRDGAAAAASGTAAGGAAGAGGPIFEKPNHLFGNLTNEEQLEDWRTLLRVVNNRQ